MIKNHIKIKIISKQEKVVVQPLKNQLIHILIGWLKLLTIDKNKNKNKNGNAQKMMKLTNTEEKLSLKNSALEIINKISQIMNSYIHHIIQIKCQSEISNIPSNHNNVISNPYQITTNIINPKIKSPITN
jgi:hypothetical protein